MIGLHHKQLLEMTASRREAKHWKEALQGMTARGHWKKALQGSAASKDCKGGLQERPVANMISWSSCTVDNCESAMGLSLFSYICVIRRMRWLLG